MPAAAGRTMVTPPGIEPVVLGRHVPRLQPLPTFVSAETLSRSTDADRYRASRAGWARGSAGG
jgi:hypothetical protein